MAALAASRKNEVRYGLSSGIVTVKIYELQLLGKLTACVLHQFLTNTLNEVVAVLVVSLFRVATRV